MGTVLGGSSDLGGEYSGVCVCGGVEPRSIKLTSFLCVFSIIAFLSFLWLALAIMELVNFEQEYVRTPVSQVVETEIVFVSKQIRLQTTQG